MSENSRRNFIKVASISAIGLSFLKSFKAQAAAPMVDENTDQMAKTVGYKSDSSKVDVKKYPNVAKVEPDGVKPQCRSCVLYKTAEGSGATEKGTCGLFAGKQVMGSGWCNSWARNAAYKAKK